MDRSEFAIQTKLYRMFPTSGKNNSIKAQKILYPRFIGAEYKSVKSTTRRTRYATNAKTSTTNEIFCGDNNKAFLNRFIKLDVRNVIVSYFRPKLDKGTQAGALSR